MQGERYAPDHAAIILAAHKPRIDPPAGGEGTDQTSDADLPQLGIYLHLRKHGAVRMHGVVRLRRRVRRAVAPPIDFRDPGSREDIAIALAAAFIVSAEQPPSPGHDARIVGAE